MKVQPGTARRTGGPVYFPPTFVPNTCWTRACSGEMAHFQFAMFQNGGRTIRGHLASSAVIWRHLASSGLIWTHLASSGLIWRHLASNGVIWRHLASSGHIWRHLASSGRIRPHLASRRLIDLFTISPFALWYHLCTIPCFLYGIFFS